MRRAWLRPGPPGDADHDRAHGVQEALEVTTTQQQGTTRGDTAGGDDGDLRVGHLARIGFATQLLHGLVDIPEAVGTALGELATMRVERQLTVHRDALAAAGFQGVCEKRMVVPQGPIGPDYLKRVENRFISTFNLLSEDEFNTGLARLRADILARGSLDVKNEWETVAVWARKDTG